MNPGAPTASSDTAPIAAAIPHAVEGKEQCSTCHGDSASLVPMPVGHSAGAGRDVYTMP
jgi:mono/diheme cytochrome c family protein